MLRTRSNDFWRIYHGTGGMVQQYETMRNYKNSQFWKDGEWELCNPLDAPEYLPTGGSIYCNHTIHRESMV